MHYHDDRVLIVAPTGRDAANASEVLDADGIPNLICRDIPEICRFATSGAGALLLTQESLTRSGVQLLATLLAQQPPWSDLPLIVLASGGEATSLGLTVLRELGSKSAVTVLDRPLRRLMLVSAARAALRARRKQGEVRDLLKQRESMFQELRERARILEASQQALMAAKETISKHADELEKTVKERTARVLETNAQLEAFSYSISHDMRGPLRAMRQYAQILVEENHGLDQEGQNYLDRISRAAARMDRLIQDVLLYSRASRSEIQLAKVDLDKLVHEIVQQYPGFQPPQALIEINAPLQPVIGHEASLTQCISNLLSNAVKFVPAGRKPEVRIFTAQDNGMVRICVQDNGIGIAPKNQERIFNIFERVHGAHEYEGTGIGLSIVKKTVERMGGSVGLQSEVGAGTKFWIDLPSHNKNRAAVQQLM